jgi:subtilase family serine protease
MLFLLLGMLPSAKAQTAGIAKAAVPYPNAETPKAVDLGTAQAAAAPMSVTIALHISNLSEAENLLKSLHTPGDPQFDKFLTTEQFVARFGPADADVAKVGASLSKYGLAVERTTATTLKVTGPAAAMENAFAVSLHSYEVPAHGNVAGYTYRAPLNRPTIPSEISGLVSGVFGLDTRPTLRPHILTVPKNLAVAKSAARLATPKGDAFGSLTVADFAAYYDVDPLYARGVKGRGRTIGIVTFASMTLSDAIAYWTALGLDFDPNRISVVNVDGGPGAPSDASGSRETTLDVEQSGGIAPGAKVIIYQGTNTNQGFVDAFAAAADANVADTLSTSWGFWEWFDNLENAPVTDPITGNTVSLIQATHEFLVRAAIQGQSISATSGDAGAYDVQDSVYCYGPYSPAVPQSCSEPLAVDYPGSDTAMTSGGGTTLAFTAESCLNAACTPPYYTINVPHERVWGWDYFEGLCAAQGVPDPTACGIFPVGSGGGVSFEFLEPFYQFGVQGIQLTQPGQVWIAGPYFYETDGVGTFFVLPPYFPGRNVPDASFNADPYTGYEIYYTSDVSGFEILKGYGGTSFVAPQLNGVSALFGDYVHGRIGLLNYVLYDLVSNGQAYEGPSPPLRAIKYGDNWFYHGSDGYNPAVGAGTIDVANFADALRDQH